MSDTMPRVAPETARSVSGETDPLDLMIQQINDRLDAGRAARLALTDRVTALETALTALAARIVRVVTVSGPAGTIALTGFASIIEVIPKETWASQQMIVGAASAITKTGFTATVMRSKGTLLLTSGPFETAPAGTVATFVVIGLPA